MPPGWLHPYLVLERLNLYYGLYIYNIKRCLIYIEMASSLCWLLDHQNHTLNLNTRARCLSLVTKTWLPDMSEPLLLPFTAGRGFSVILGALLPWGRTPSESQVEFNLPAVMKVNPRKVFEVFFPLIRNGRQESSVFWVLYNQHELFRTKHLSNK